MEAEAEAAAAAAAAAAAFSMPSSLSRLAAGAALLLVPPSRAEPSDGSSRSIPALSSQMRTCSASHGGKKPRQFRPMTELSLPIAYEICCC